jgi:acyl carrier protein
MNTEKIIRSIVESSYAGCKVESLDMGLTSELGLDSLDKIDILVKVERVCRVRIPDVLAEKIETVADLVCCVKELRAGVPVDRVLSKKVSGGRVVCSAYRIDDGRVKCNLTGTVCPEIKPTMAIKPDVDMCALVKCARYQQYQKTK